MARHFWRLRGDYDASRVIHVIAAVWGHECHGVEDGCRVGRDCHDELEGLGVELGTRLGTLMKFS